MSEIKKQNSFENMSMSNRSEMESMTAELQGKLGFGCMRLPLKEGKVDDDAFNQMIDAFMEAGFNYFDTAHPYLETDSEKAIGRTLALRYPRSSFLLANKLSPNCFNSQEEIRPFFEQQLKDCHVDYFDYYLMHCQNAKYFEKYKNCSAYETAFELKKEGKVRHVGFSFHDCAEVLDQILTEYPQFEFVQLQFNYLDQKDPSVQSRACYDVAAKHGKPVIVMEPVKGGTLASFEGQAKTVFEEACQDASPASLALRYAAGHDQVMMVLSGMGSMEMMEDNIKTFQNLQPLSDEEKQTVDQIVNILQTQKQIGCTGCRYCTDGCPAGIEIPEVFKALNAKRIGEAEKAAVLYEQALEEGSSASSCLSCGQCEAACPQSLSIIDLLKEASQTLEA